MSAVQIPAELLDETIESLERIGCQFWACDGPTLEPVNMVTCHACHLLARLRVAVGRPPRLPHELSIKEIEEQERQRNLRRAVAR